MRKKLISIATDAIRADAECFIQNHKAYAARNNYDYFCASEVVFADRHPSFSKVPLTERALSDGNEIVIFADIDVAFMDQGVDLANLLIGTDFWMGAYWQQNFDRFKYLCCGLFVVKNCHEARRFFDRWSDCCINGGPGETPSITHHPWEQWAASALFQDIEYKGIRPCSAAEIGSFGPGWDDGVKFQLGFPTIHFAGQGASMNDKARIFQSKYAGLVC